MKPAQRVLVFYNFIDVYRGSQIQGAFQEPLCLAYQSAQLASRAPSLAALDSLAQLLRGCYSRLSRQVSLEPASVAIVLHLTRISVHS